MLDNTDPQVVLARSGTLADLQELDPHTLVIDEHGTVKTLLHTVNDWPGHHQEMPEKIAWLVAQGVPVDAPAVNPKSDARETALHWAASADDVIAIDALVAAGADLEAMGAVITGGTPMADAVVFCQHQAAACLLRHGAQTTPWQAGALGLIDVVETALPTLTTIERNAALWHACRGHHPAIVTLLVDAGADLDWVGPKGWTPRQAAEDSGWQP